MRKHIIPILTAVLCCSLTAWGATIKLKDGSELQGEIVEKGKTTVKIKIEGGLELEIDGDKIVSVDGEKYTVDVRAAYDDELRKIDDTKADDQYRIADWCRGRRLDAESKMHLRKAIEIDPKHEGANLALGKVYVEQEGAWMDRADARAKGYTVGKGSGKWVTENEAMAERGLKEYKGYMLSDAEIKAMKAREIKRYKSLYYTHAVCDLRNEITHIDFLNKCSLDKKQLEEMFAILLEAENKRQFFRDQIHAINARVELAYNRLKEEGIKGVFNTYDRPPGVEDAAQSAELEVMHIEKGFGEQMTPMVEQMMKLLEQMKGSRMQKGSALFAMDHDYCMCCHGKAKMQENSECAACHKGGRKYGDHPAELAAIKEVRNIPGDQWAAQKDKIISKWCRPVPMAEADGKPLPKMEIKRREMMERQSIEKLLVETRDYPATDFERNKEMLAAKLACKDASERTRIELKVLGERRHKLSHNMHAIGMLANCFFDGTLFDFVSDKLGKKKTALLASAGKGTGLVEKQTVVTGKAAFEEYCSFCHPLERVMVRVRTGAMGPEMWGKGVPYRLRYWKGDWSEEEMQQRSQAIIDHILELESKYTKKDKKDEF